MATRFLIVFLSVLVLFEMTTSFPLSRQHMDREYEMESGAESGKSHFQTLPETPLKTQADIYSAFIRVDRSSKRAHDHHGHIHKHRGHGSSHVRLLSRDQSKSTHTRSWFEVNRKNPKFIAISIFVGCLVFMSLAFALACCVRYWVQTKRVKKATHVDVRSRQELPEQVSRIGHDDVHVDVRKY